MEHRGKRRGCLKIGCVSAVIVVGVLFASTVILFATAFFGSRSESVARQELRREIQGPAPGITPALPDSLAGQQGRVILDFTVGEFAIEPAEPGEPIRVEAEYDTSAYALEENFEPSTGSGWVYRVRFRQTGLIKDGGLRILFGSSYPEVRVFLPPDVPIALQGRFGKGGTNIELGGLWLTEIDLELDKGSLDVDIDRPLVAPVRSLRIYGKQGGMSARRIGNASPAEVDISWRMGGSDVDLRGHWLNDSDVRVRNLMGGSTVYLPRDVRIEGLPDRGPLLAPSDEELPPPTLRISTSNFMGGQEIIQ